MSTQCPHCGRHFDAVEDLQPSSRRAGDSQRVFGYWLKEIHLGSKAYRLTPKRHKKIQARLKEGFTAQELEEAITGCKLTPHNMGDNDRKEPFNDLELICRNPENVERFRDTARRLLSNRQMAPQGLRDVPYWGEIREILAKSVDPNTWKLWLEPIKALGMNDHALYVETSASEWCRRHYSGLILEAAREVMNCDKVEFV